MLIKGSNASRKAIIKPLKPNPALRQKNLKAALSASAAVNNLLLSHEEVDYYFTMELISKDPINEESHWHFSSPEWAP